MKFSEYRKRLEYKCLINNIKIEIINEAYTSKVCSTFSKRDTIYPEECETVSVINNQFITNCYKK